MNNLQLFENPKFGQIRVVQIDNEFGDDLNQTYPISDNLGRIQQTIFITDRNYIS